MEKNAQPPSPIELRGGLSIFLKGDLVLSLNWTHAVLEFTSRFLCESDNMWQCILPLFNIVQRVCVWVSALGGDSHANVRKCAQGTGLTTPLVRRQLPIYKIKSRKGQNPATLYLYLKICLVSMCIFVFWSLLLTLKKFECVDVPRELLYAPVAKAFQFESL